MSTFLLHKTLKAQSELVLKILFRQWIQYDQILIFKTQGSTFATEQNNILISPTLNFELT